MSAGADAPTPGSSFREPLLHQLSRPVRLVMPQLPPIDPKRLAIDRRFAARRRDGRFRHQRVRRGFALVAEEGAAVGAPTSWPTVQSYFRQNEQRAPGSASRSAAMRRRSESSLSPASRFGSPATIARSSSLDPLAARMRRRRASRGESGPVIASCGSLSIASSERQAFARGAARTAGLIAQQHSANPSPRRARQDRRTHHLHVLVKMLVAEMSSSTKSSDDSNKSRQSNNRAPPLRRVNSACLSSNLPADTFRQFFHPPSAPSSAQPNSDRPLRARPDGSRSPSHSTVAP
jgi:hypothetical protein